jgi:dUTP pyrophosphatase
MPKFQEPKYIFNIKIQSSDLDVINYYNNYKTNHLGDAGIDLYTPQNIMVYNNNVGTVDYQIAGSMINIETDEYVSYYMYPRSSISNTKFILANSVGIIDAGYRGTYKGKFYNTNNDEINQIESYIIIKKGTKLCQICAPDLSPIIVNIVEELDETSRGIGGFGSTNK